MKFTKCSVPSCKLRSSTLTTSNISNIWNFSRLASIFWGSGSAQHHHPIKVIRLQYNTVWTCRWNSVQKHSSLYIYCLINGLIAAESKLPLFIRVRSIAPRQQPTPLSCQGFWGHARLPNQIAPSHLCQSGRLSCCHAYTANCKFCNFVTQSKALIFNVLMGNRDLMVALQILFLSSHACPRSWWKLTARQFCNNIS